MNATNNFRERALRFFPGGSNGEYGIPEGDAPVIERGRGCRVWDTGGREYLDMTMAWGAALIGHAHPKVLEAASAAAANGANFAAVNRSMVELAERIADLSPRGRPSRRGPPRPAATPDARREREEWRARWCP